jgi:hypothetical protein
MFPVLAVSAALHVSAASASSTQISIMTAASAGSATAELSTLRALGVTEVRVPLSWASVAPAGKQPSNPSSPNSYPASAWAQYDAFDTAAAADRITVDFDIGNPSPRWAQAGGAPGYLKNSGNWKPNAAEFGSFVKAVATRYNGHNGLPRVSNWSIWNEPNYGPSLAPQASEGGRVVVAATYYRNLVDAADSAFKATGHGGDTITFGETAPHGYANGGIDSGTAPLIFLRALYCVGSNYRPLTGSLASASGCPTTARASRSFRSKNPLLFTAKGFAAHLYAQGQAPNKTLASRSPCARIDTADSADLANAGKLASTLDSANRAYGSHSHLNIYNTEYGFQTDPPETPACNVRPVSQDTAAVYDNWGEYLSWKNSRIASFDQYLLVDPQGGNFASGLIFADGTQKAGYDAFQVPLFMPTTSVRSASTLEVWGGARSSHFGGASNVLLQFQPNGGSWSTVATPGLSHGYFDTHVRFTQSGSLRVVWVENGTNYLSRTQTITVG